jgi:SET family sugar efflux transporter-like MFS transporter
MSKLRLLFLQREFAMLIACNVVMGLGYSLVMPFTSLFGTRALGLSPWSFGLFMTANALAGIAISTRLARWSDTHVSRKAVFLISAASGAAGYAAYAFLRDPWRLLPISCVLLGIGAVTFSQTFAMARDLLARRGVPKSDVPYYINVIRLTFAFSWVVGPAVGAKVLARHSFRGTYLAAAAFILLAVVLGAFGLERLPPSEKSKAAAASLPLSLALRRPAFLAHFLAFVLIQCCSSMGMMNLPLLILHALHGTEAHVGMAYSLAPLFEVPLLYYAGVLATRVPTVRIIRGAALLAVAYYAGLASVQAPWQVLPLQFLSAALVAVNSGLAITFFQDFLPDQAGTATNLHGTAARIGSTAGYLIFGALGATLGYRAVFAVCGVFCATAWLIMVRWRPRAAPEPEGVGVQGANGAEGVLVALGGSIGGLAGLGRLGGPAPRMRPRLDYV